MRTTTLLLKRAILPVLFTLLLSMAGAPNAMAQQRVPKNDIRQATASAKKVAVGNENVNPAVNNFAPQTAKSVVVNRYDEIEDGETMWTTYDLQSNHFCSSRMYQSPNGKVSVVGTMSHLFNQTTSDRGTGYNFYNGVEWMEQPEERVESMRTGWPTIAQWGDNGEILISHSPLRCWTRQVAGQGEWVYRGELPMHPDFDTDDASWPRVATSGDHHNIIHVVADIQHYDGGTSAYVNDQVYFRSEDAENWTITYSPLADVGYASGSFSAEDYAITANGHNVAILYSGSLTNSVWMFKSTDDGLTWNARKVWEDPYEGIDLNDPDLVYTDTLYRPMNGAIVIDNNGVVHVALNTFEMAHFADSDLGYYTYWSGRAVDGILYWNDTYEGPIESEDGNPHHAARLWWPDEENPGYITMHNDPTKWIGYMPMYDDYEWDNDHFYHESDYHSKFYGTSGHPALSCDPQGNLACAFSSPCIKRTDDNGEYYYRSIYVSYRDVENGYWEQMEDELTDEEVSFMYYYSENLFTISAPNTYVPGEFWFGFQSDDQIGLYWGSNASQTDASENLIHAVKVVHNPGASDYNYISVTANPANGGTVTGSGYYQAGQTCTLTATANQNYNFMNWTRNGNVVSTNPTYSFTVTETAAYVANFSENPISGNGELDYTTYDWQSNSGAITRTIVWPDGKVNFAYTMASNTSYSDRGIGIGTYDAENDEWIPSGGRVEDEKTGFGSIARYGQNGIVVAAHTATDCRIYILEDKDNIEANSVSVTSVLDNTYEPTWPNVMTSGSNRDIIHVVATAYDHITIPGMEDVYQPILYFRSQDGGQTWDKQNFILPFMDADYCLDWGSNVCYWMETTDDNCLALVVNNAWSDGMVIYSYDNGDTWQRKVFYKHPNPFGTFDNWFMYPRWTSCQWDSQHRLHVLYEFNGSTGETGSNSFYPNIGGVAYWNETMPYNINGITSSAIPDNLTPGQPFVMDSAYIRNDIYASWWLWSDASHEMWPEYIGYLPALTDDGDPEPNPYNVMEFNIEDRGSHGAYNGGCVAMPVLCMVPGTDDMVAVWCAMDENHTDVNGNFYYKLFASMSTDGGMTWSTMKHLTKYALYDNTEFVFPQAVVVGNKLVIACQMDGATGSYVQSDDADPYDNYYGGLTFDLGELFNYIPNNSLHIIASANPANGGSVTGSGYYQAGQTCTLRATANEGYTFVNWTKSGEVVSTSATYSFTVTENATYVANFSASNASHWDVDIHQYPYNMSVTGILQINGVEQQTETLEIGAFCGDECRGTQMLTYFPQVDRYLVYLTLYGDAGDVMNFRLYDHSIGEELNLSCSSTISFVTDGFTGTPFDPYVFDFNLTIDQVTNFSQGYNWWGTYIEQNDINGLQMLQDGLGSNGVSIRTQVGYTEYYAGYGWYGPLSSINNESSYKVITSAPCTVTMTGSAAVPSQHPITVSQGWTWIGYVPTTAMSVNAAMAGVNATTGDKVKSQQGYADYYPGYGWFGSLNTIEPGMGLMYYSTNSNPVTFVYPDSGRGGELKRNITAENNHWIPNVYAYPDNMTVMAVVDLNDVELNSEHYELAAFAANGECRGSVKLTYAEALHRHVAFLTIAGKDATELSFRLYNTDTNEEYYDAEESLDFTANAIIGAADNLYVVHFRGTTGMDEFANKVKVYPNPVNAGERFSIVMNVESKTPVRVEIVNALGEIVSVETSMQSPMSIVAPVTSGVYTLRISCDEGTCCRKVIVR